MQLTAVDEERQKEQHRKVYRGKHSSQEKRNTYKEHFIEGLANEAADASAQGNINEEVLQKNSERPSKAETEKAIFHMERRKASGRHTVPVEAIKTNIHTSTEILYDLIGEKEEIPTEWKEGYLVNIPKKGGLQECQTTEGKCSYQWPERSSTESSWTDLRYGCMLSSEVIKLASRKDRSYTYQTATFRLIVDGRKLRKL